MAAVGEATRQRIYTPVVFVINSIAELDKKAQPTSTSSTHGGRELTHSSMGWPVIMWWNLSIGGIGDTTLRVAGLASVPVRRVSERRDAAKTSC